MSESWSLQHKIKMAIPNEEIEKLIKKTYNKYNGGFADSYDQALELGCYDEIIMMREFAKELLKLELENNKNEN